MLALECWMAADDVPDQDKTSPDGMKFLRCSRCGETKERAAFYAKPSRCKACVIIAAAESRARSKAADPERHREGNARSARNRYRADPEAGRAKGKAWRDANLEAARAMYARSYAKDKGKRQAAWRAANPERARVNAQIWRQENLEHVMATQAAWRRENADAFSAIRKDWIVRNPHKGTEHAAKRRARMLNASPSWLTPAQRAEIEGFYLFTSIFGGEVDHIVPLAGKSVCGLHVPWNLQILSRSENARKNNRLM